MTTTINGRTPDEIKKGLNHCSEDGCKQCPYKDDCDMADGFSVLAGDALAYIRQLENHIGELTEKVEQIKAEQQNLLCDFSVACLNIEKLKRRHPEGFDAEHSLHREDE